MLVIATSSFLSCLYYELHHFCRRLFTQSFFYFENDDFEFHQVNFFYLLDLMQPNKYINVNGICLYPFQMN